MIIYCWHLKTREGHRHTYIIQSTGNLRIPDWSPKATTKPWTEQGEKPAWKQTAIQQLRVNAWHVVQQLKGKAYSGWFAGGTILGAATYPKETTARFWKKSHFHVFLFINCTDAAGERKTTNRKGQKEAVFCCFSRKAQIWSDCKGLSGQQVLCDCVLQLATRLLNQRLQQGSPLARKGKPPKVGKVLSVPTSGTA